MIYGILVVALIFTVSMLLRHEFALNDRGIFLWKPLSSTLMTVILLAAFFRADPSDSTYTLALLPGVLLCFGGDMALMFTKKSSRAFLIGLVLFLLGHVAYTVTFIAFNGFHSSDWISAAVLAVFGLGVYLYILPGLGSMKVPVLFYVLIISLMVNRGLSTFSGNYFSPVQAWLISLGAILFYISDVVLALGKFRHAWKYGRINLAFYYAGQVCIAMSAGFHFL
ncbi:MAG: lysoplasmalogenase [Spirochaetales bacterium]|nr:lysoplasmalogenase [Spirochaetales bacterium]